MSIETVWMWDCRKFWQSCSYYLTTLSPTQDILDEVCNRQQPLIPPVARPLFALCDTKTGFCLSPYQTLTPSEARRQYQLRLFVNTGENGVHLQRMSRTVHNIYWQQVRVVREDLIEPAPAQPVLSSVQLSHVHIFVPYSVSDLEMFINATWNVDL